MGVKVDNAAFIGVDWTVRVLDTRPPSVLLCQERAKKVYSTPHGFVDTRPSSSIPWLGRVSVPL